MKKRIKEKVHDVVWAASVFQTEEQIKNFCEQKLGLTPRESTEAMEEARRRIRAAADYDLTAELGQALVRNDYLYRQAVLAQDLKTAARVMRDRATLLGIGAKTVAPEGGIIEYDADAAEMEAALENVRGQLESLGAVPPGLEIEDLARAVVIRFLELEKRCLSLETPRPDGEIK